MWRGAMRKMQILRFFKLYLKYKTVFGILPTPKHSVSASNISNAFGISTAYRQKTKIKTKFNYRKERAFV